MEYEELPAVTPAVRSSTIVDGLTSAPDEIRFRPYFHLSTSASGPSETLPSLSNTLPPS
jgi:hypothetical protein